MSSILGHSTTRHISNRFASRLLFLIALMTLLGLSFVLQSPAVKAGGEAPSTKTAIVAEPSSDSSLTKDAMSKLRLNVAPYSSLMATPSDPPGLQSGDLLVGAVNGGIDTGAIFRVRGNTSTIFCIPGPTFFNLPEHVMVDSQGRVVFLAYLGSFNFSRQGYGLFRCNAMGTTPELLAVIPGNAGDARTPNPFPNESIEAVGGLHLARLPSITLGDSVTISTEDAYVFVVAQSNPTNGQRTGLKSVRYHPATGTWDDGPEPVQLYARSASTGVPDMVYHSGVTYSVHDGVIRRQEMPLQINASGRIGNVDFNLSLSLFGGRKEIANGMITDDEMIPNVDSGCMSHDGITDAMPFEGGFLPTTAFYNVVYDESGGLGLVITSTGTPYLTNVSEALLNDDPGDDRAQYFHDSYLGCTAVPSLHYSRILPVYSSDPANPYTNNNVSAATGSLTSSSGGLMGTQAFANRVIHIVPGDHVETVTTSLINPVGIGAYPSQVSAGFGTTIIVQINSPLDVLVTDASGKRIGVDPTTGLAVNDFGENGFDSGPGEPRFYGIKNPAPGSYSVHSMGTGDGAFTINIFSADLTQPTGNHISASGVASIGSLSDHDFTLSTDTAIAFNTPPAPADNIAPMTSVAALPSANLNGWNNANVTVNLNALDNAGGTGVKQITYSASGAQPIANTIVSGGSTSIAISNEGQTAISYFATDNAGNVEISKTLNIKLDKTPPTISAPSNASYQCAGQVPPADVSAATATDNFGPPTLTVSESTNGGAGSPASPLIISRVFTARDAANNAASSTQTISVIDNMKPIINCPANITMMVNLGSNNALVSYLAATATDNCAVPIVSCSKASGSSFPLGTTSVSCTATDSSNNTGACSFTVTVLTPQGSAQQLIDKVNTLVSQGVLNQGNGNALTVKLQAAISSMNRGNNTAACNQLQAFINQVQAFISTGKLTPAQGQPLINSATAVMSVLGC